jgi:hypothetical protein
LNSRGVWTDLFVSGLIVLFLVCNGVINAFSENISMGDIQAMIQIISPLNNASYGGDVSLNVNVMFYTYSQTNSTVIPVRDVACTYSLDSGEWSNASLNSVSRPSVHWDWVNQLYIIETNASYYATLQSLSTGLHFVSVDLKPDAIHDFDTRTVKFYVSGDGQSVPTPKFPIQESLALLVAVLIGSVISAVVIALRKRLRSPKMPMSQSALELHSRTEPACGQSKFQPLKDLVRLILSEMSK